MQHTKELTIWLRTQLPWQGARIKFTALFLLALIHNKTVNFSKLALDFSSDAKSESSYRRIQNFFANFSFEQDLLARLLLSLLPLKDKRVLLMDRTNWRFGRLDINILLIAVHYRGIGIPLVWSMLPKAGNSNSHERQALMDRLLRLAPAETIEVFLADREFIGQSWFAYLNQRRVPFVIRIRKDSLCDGWLGVHCFFKNLPLAQAKVLYHRYSIFGESLAVAGMRLENDYCIVVTNSNPQLALARYRLRWSIELLFAALKTTGFDIETTHLKHLERIDKLLSLTALAFTWALKVGLYLHESGLKPLKLKAHDRWEKSFFRHGLDYLIFILNHISRKQKEFSLCLQLLSCT